ncbi:type II toxin-antitoxin system YafQ family toxin [Bifidobacterium gallicum]|uniref:Addiction module toxin, RelE/StbE family n=1 Tax=Bifidobacterium gallicum DSM 20093 = LMG 11596 TaxID=561180 RepID=D1NT41_9BIFI|nr:type II toxin-antitoxin system YafQ family toxin [Bifidobacterium gallicum]EFA23843.1 addiction module toxin, RelE/StbE family [Bifidobacterium gallicum DSM 20093 = LMG 11596]
MMYKVKFTATFKKSYKLMKKRGLDISLLDDVIDQLRQGKQLDKKYHDHNLSGNLSTFRECHIKPDWLLVYLIENDILTLTLVDTGSHSDIFKE